MGSWSVYCGISQIAITAGQECVLLPLKTNKGEYLPFIPATLPIFGKYDDYGGIEDIVEDENTKLIEEHFGVSIQNFTVLLLDGRFTYERDEAKKVVKKMKHAKEAKEWRFMWIDRKVYDFMSSYISQGYGGKGHLDFGKDYVLKLLGFERTGDTDDKRYTQKWTLKGVDFASDGTWLHHLKTNEGIHNLTGASYSNLTDHVAIDEDKLWLNDKASWELWEHFSKKEMKENLLWIVGCSRYNDFGDDERWNELLKTIVDKLVSEIDKNDPNYDVKVSEIIKAHPTTKVKDPETLLEKYVLNAKTYGKQLCELVSLRHNLHPMSGYFAPYVLYLTPQCGEYKHHQVLLNKFSEINNERYKQLGGDEDEDE